ncbi:MAG: sulfatase-like hydrolase/transferase [Deltaproteobacteria bacterium]|nr:sulfatase-like hydrolase/transferase [Deltaproteobacteria bacterium]
MKDKDGSRLPCTGVFGALTVSQVMDNPAKVLIRLLLAFVIGNGLLFFAYRLFFLWSFASDLTASDVIGVSLRGLRFDVALMGLETGLLGLAFWWRGLRFRALFTALLGFTYVHALACFSNYLFFQERGQHFWEMFMANVTEPKEMYIAVAPLFFHQPVLAVLLAGASLGLAAFWSRMRPRFSKVPANFVAAVGGRGRAIILLLILFSLSLEPIIIKRMIRKTEWPIGLRPGIAASTLYMGWSDYRVNQGIVNPVFDFVTYHLPGSLSLHRQFTLDRAEALAMTRALIGAPQSSGAYPLLREIRSDLSLGIENVILLQVEGLSDSYVHLEVKGRPVMPFLQRLTREWLYFPKVIQSFNATDGSVFATFTGFPETFVDRNAVDFLEYDSGGHYASLSRLLGERNYQHFFFQAFRHRTAQYLAFARNQGYQAYGVDYFESRLGGGLPKAEVGNVLGVFDGVFLQEAADALIRAPKKFTAHIVTATSHSPWTTPPSFGAVFDEKVINSFHYADRSLEAFVERLRKELPRFDRTLIVIVADHTSTRAPDLLRRIHVPLFFFSTGLLREKDRWLKQREIWGSHIDIVPTILDLLGGHYCYSGMGQSLLSATALGKGVLSGSRGEGYYVKDQFAFRYASPSGAMSLHAIGSDQGSGGTDVAQEQAMVFEQMRREYFALYETSKHLTRERNAFPSSGTGACK